jgi:hypothetical protein
VYEPATTLTDYGLTVLSMALGWVLLRQARHDGVHSRMWWAAAFLALALSALLGGTYHGFAPMLGRPTGVWLWRLTTYAIGAAALCMALAANRAALPGRLRGWIAASWSLAYSAFLLAMWSRDDFLLVIAFYLSAVAFVTALQIVAWARGHRPEARWIAAGCVVSLLAAALQQSGIRLAAWFNHNDLYHVVQALALYAWYRGAREVADARTGP